MTDETGARGGTNWLLLVPIIVTAVLVGGFALALKSNREDAAVGVDPGALPSPFIGRPMPPLAETPLGSYPSFSTEEIMADGEVKIVNFFASWCPPCRDEHPALMQLAEEGVPIYGVNKSDQEAQALAFIEDLGNPYTGITVDANGRQAIDWGVVALPETFVVDGEGTVILKFPGPIHGVMDTIIRPALAEAAGG